MHPPAPACVHCSDENAAGAMIAVCHGTQDARAVFDVYADVQEQFYERAGRRAGPME
jgi:hypothetical protein